MEKLEGDFFGNTQESIGLFRLRHAYAQLAWENLPLTLGQTWYPSFLFLKFSREFANFSTGIMFNPFGWVGQIRFRQSLTSNLSLDFRSFTKTENFKPCGSGNANNSPSFNFFLLYMRNCNTKPKCDCRCRCRISISKTWITSGGLASDEN